MTVYWIEQPARHGPLGFGVTALSLTDALLIIRTLGYGDYLPDDLGSLKVQEGVSVHELDHQHVVANMGPIIVRGMWYPFVVFDVLSWAEAKLRSAPESHS